MVVLFVIFIVAGILVLMGFPIGVAIRLVWLVFLIGMLYACNIVF